MQVRLRVNAETCISNSTVLLHHICLLPYSVAGKRHLFTSVHAIKVVKTERRKLIFTCSVFNMNSSFCSCDPTPSFFACWQLERVNLEPWTDRRSGVEFVEQMLCVLGVLAQIPHADEVLAVPDPLLPGVAVREERHHVPRLAQRCRAVGQRPQQSVPQLCQVRDGRFEVARVRRVRVRFPLLHRKLT